MAKQASRWLSLFDTFARDLRIISKEVISEDGRGVPLDMWESQRRFMNEVGEGLDAGIHVFNCLKSRQLGITTISLALVDVFWLAMHKNIIGCMVTDTEKNRDANRMLIEHYVNSFPEGYFGDDFRIVKSNRQFMLFSGGQRLDLLVAGVKKKPIAWGQGQGYALAHVTEIGNFADPEGMKSLEEGFAVTNPHRLFVFESTAKGYNHWRTRWYAGLDDKLSQRSFFIGWWASKVNVIERNDPRFLRHNYAPRGEEREKIRAVAQLYGHKITAEQLAWIRWKEAQAGQEQDLLQQNQPWCLVAGTRVGTKRGILSISELKAGDTTKLGSVLHAGMTGSAAIWKAQTKFGYAIEGTANHPLINVAGEEVTIKNSLGSVVRLSAPEFADEIYTERWSEGVLDYAVRITPDFARLIGLFMGDGSLSGQGARSGYQLSICCDSKDRDVIDECHRLIRSLFGIATQENSCREVGDGGWTTVKVTSRLVYDTFRKLNLVTTATGKIQRLVHVPEFIWRSPKHVVKEFLSGLFEADGHAAKSGNAVIFASKHDGFCRDVQLLLLGFGITCRTFPTLGRIKQNNNNGKVYTSTRMELRALETAAFHDKIGFLSERKRARATSVAALRRGKGCNRLPIIFQDQVVRVEPTGRYEPVYNLTTTAPHWFDANGVVTHNTAEDAFVATGYSFFQTRMISADIKRILDGNQNEGLYKYKGYRYNVDGDFFNFSLQELKPSDPGAAAQVELKVWEEPQKDGRYVIGFDPAYGRNEHGDFHAMSVWRCFADKMVQVAEYKANDVEVKHAAWILFHLCAAYGDCMANVELGGPGRLVMSEFQHLRELLAADMNREKVKSRDWTDAALQARWFLYHKVDSPGPGYVANFETNWRTKRELLYGLRGAYVSHELDISSVPLLKEMQNVIVDGETIGAPESANEDQKDDLVFAMALAHRAWSEWVKREMLSQGMTYEKVMSGAYADLTPMARSVNGMIQRFLLTQIQKADAPVDNRDPWFVQRGLQ